MFETKQEQPKQEVKKEEKKEEVKPQQQPIKPMRQIIIETDGNNIKIVKADVAGNLELRAILIAVLEKLK